MSIFRISNNLKSLQFWIYLPCNAQIRNSTDSFCSYWDCTTGKITSKFRRVILICRRVIKVHLFLGFGTGLERLEIVALHQCWFKRNCQTPTNNLCVRLKSSNSCTRPTFSFQCSSCGSKFGRGWLITNLQLSPFIEITENRSSWKLESDHCSASFYRILLIDRSFQRD